MEKFNLLNLELALPSMDENETRVLMGGTNYMDGNVLPEVVVYPDNFDPRDGYDPEDDEREEDSDPDTGGDREDGEPDESNDKVNTYPQSTPGGCVWACMATVLELLGYETDEKTQDVLKGMVTDVDPENMSNAEAMSVVTSYFEDSEVIGLNPTAEALEEALNDETGIIIASWNPDVDGDGDGDSTTDHAVVIYDVDTEEGTFSYWDPSDNESHNDGDVDDIKWAIDIDGVEK